MKHSASRFPAPLCAVALLMLVMAALFAGLLPLTMPFGWAAGGVLETGQVALQRWWLATVVALSVGVLLFVRLPSRLRLWWMAILAAGLAASIIAFGFIASSDQPRGETVAGSGGRALRVGVVTALPLFWAGDINGQLRNRAGAMPLVRASGHRLVAIDHADARALARVDTLVLAQPRLMQPEELVAIDAWIRAGGRAVIFADPLLLWPTEFSLGDPRRPPLTSLLDPLLAHWGLKLEPADVDDAARVKRRALATGHVLLFAEASRFSVMGGDAGAHCRLDEAGLFALCRVGKGQARLMADADVLDDRLWLADPRRPERREAHTSDIIALLDSWAADPLAPPKDAAPLRVTNEAVLVRAMRAAILSAILWAGLGWLGHRRLAGGLARNHPSTGENRK